MLNLPVGIQLMAKNHNGTWRELVKAESLAAIVRWLQCGKTCRLAYASPSDVINILTDEDG